MFQAEAGVVVNWAWEGCVAPIFLMENYIEHTKKKI